MEAMEITEFIFGLAALGKVIMLEKKFREIDILKD